MKMQWIFITLTGIFLLGCATTPTVDLDKSPNPDGKTKEQNEYDKANELNKRIKELSVTISHQLDSK